MHVLVISSGYPSFYEPLDGIFYRDQANALKAKGIKVGVISAIPISIVGVLKKRRLKLGRSFATENEIPTYTWSYLNIPKRPSYSVKMAERKGMKMFRDYVKNYGVPEIVHLHCFEGGLLAIAIKKEFGIDFVVTEHSSRFLLNTNPAELEPVIRKVYQNAVQRIAVSNNLKDVLSEKYKLPFTYVPNVVDLTKFSIDEKIDKYEEFTFVNVAGLNTNKNHSMLLDAFKMVLDAGIDARLSLIGNGPLIAELNEKMSKLDLGNHVHFLGFKTREELHLEYNKSHAFVLASKKETFGVVIIEALSCGLPVIATKCGGPESIITDASLGELCDVTADALSAAMQKVYHNFSSFEPGQLSQHCTLNFSGNAVAEKLIDLYFVLLHKDKNE